MRWRRLSDLVVYCMATEPTGEVLMKDIWFFRQSCYREVKRAWRQVLIWEGEYGHDPNYRWGVARPPR